MNATPQQEASILFTNLVEDCVSLPPSQLELRVGGLVRTQQANLNNDVADEILRLYKEFREGQ